MNNRVTERNIRDSELEYPMKACVVIHGSYYGQCPDCPFQNENPSVHLFKKTEKCDERCPFLLMIWLMNQQQLYAWDVTRPEEMKIKEVEKAINEGELDLVEETIGRVPEVVSLPLFYI